VGRLPLLPRQGFQGPIHATAATCEVANLILRDSAKIQETDAARLNRKRERAGEEPLQPLYNIQDVERVVSFFNPLGYDEPRDIAPGVRITLVEAGHLLGSASVRMRLEEDGARRELVFSGDLGPRGAPILRDPEDVDRADLVFLESTYGDRDHRPLTDTLAELVELVQDAIRRKGKVLVPSFAVGRTQTMIHLLVQKFHTGELPRFPIYVDSPMALEATRLYLSHPELLDEETLAALNHPQLQLDRQFVHPSLTADDSKKLNDVPGPCLILAGAGMCNAGRIVHHLKQNLWRPETTVLIVGFQSEGSLGRILLEGAKHVSILGEKVIVRAKVRGLGGLSAHAGQSDLLRWFDHMAHCRPEVVLVHGEAKGRDPLARLLHERYGITARLPNLGDTIRLSSAGTMPLAWGPRPPQAS
jgi:metallo-beta-lactamase family protein